MKVLTIKQPWASLIMLGYKKYEFRSWKTKYRGTILIHAGKSVNKEAVKRLKKYLPEDLPKGKILGKVDIVDCIKIDDNIKNNIINENNDIYSNLSVDEYAWKLDNVQELKDNIFVNGKLGLWNYELE